MLSIYYPKKGLNILLFYAKNFIKLSQWKVKKW